MLIKETEEQSLFEEIGDNHQSGAIETPLRPDAFDKADDQKIENIAHYFALIMRELGLDLEDDSLKGTPYRVGKMYVKELFRGLSPANKPKLSVFDNKFGYRKMLVEKDISFSSSCEHHFLPMIGRAHVGYIAGEKVIGLSKINRVVDYYARRPQVQERLSLQIFNELKAVLGTSDIIVVIEAEHMCVSVRGVEDQTSKTSTLEYGGAFENLDLRNEFFTLIHA